MSRFDPIAGNPTQIKAYESQAVWNWGLSSDGRSLALLKYGGNENRIQLLSVATGSTRDITVKDWNSFTWWEVRSFIPTWAIASRNGKYLAIPAPTVQSNVWMLENF